MYANAKTKLGEPATGTSALVRPRFSPGLLLQDDDLNLAVDYVRNLSRVMFRALFGCGVVCGFELDADEKCGKLTIAVAKGIGIDCMGDPVQVCQPQTLTVEACEQPPKPVWVAVRRVEKCCGPRTAVCAPDDDEGASVCTRLQDGFEIRVFENLPKCICACPQVPAEEPQSTETQQEPAATEAAPSSARQSRRSRSAQAAAPASRQAESATGDYATSGAATATTGSEVQEAQYGCVDCTSNCHAKHYAGECECCCDSEWILLGRVDPVANPQPSEKKWKADYALRRFVRPVLMRDPKKERPAAATGAV